jgi:hypothetical protein
MESANIVHVIGHGSANSKTLISDVIGIDSSKWVVENKYFTAPVEFVFHECDSPLPSAPCHGVIFVFDPSSRHESAARPSFWEPWMPLAKDASIRALVAHSASLDDLLSDLRYEAWCGWCAEHGLEFLEADMESTPQRGTGKSLLDDCEEDEPRGKGKDRLYEALVSNMWPVMVKKEKVIHADTTREPSSSTETFTTSTTTENREGKPFDPLSLLDIDNGVDGPDQFERALSAARDMREHALALPDEERREYAAKMSLYLMNLMGGLEDSDDEESDGQKKL